MSVFYNYCKADKESFEQEKPAFKIKGASPVKGMMTE